MGVFTWREERGLELFIKKFWGLAPLSTRYQIADLLKESLMQGQICSALAYDSQWNGSFTNHAEHAEAAGRLKRLASPNFTSF